MPCKVKICGVTTLADATAAFAFGADAIGLNFHPGSPRALGVPEAAAIVRGLDPGRCVVGVFVDSPRERIATISRSVGLTALQFHGDEDPAACVGWEPLPVIKALRVRSDAAALAREAARYPGAYILVDAPSLRYGGTGTTFDWDVAAVLDGDRLIVAGGLTPENVVAAVRKLHPAAVDVASGVEDAPGRKNHGKLEAFIRAAQGA
jgi:phosphoribosylanthranilate isomerase